MAISHRNMGNAEVTESVAQAVVDQIRQGALGDLLCFLPGVGEIRRASDAIFRIQTHWYACKIRACRRPLLIERHAHLYLKNLIKHVYRFSSRREGFGFPPGTGGLKQTSLVD